ncbi:MAG: amidohydrolase family protein [Acidimicrobiia bacterium]
MFDVWDAHQHHGTRTAELLHDPTYPPDAADGWLEAERHHRIEQMTALGIDRAILMPTNSYPRVNGIADTAHANDRVMRCVEQNPDRFLGGVGIVEPQYGPASLDEIQRLSDAGAIGFAYHPRLQGVPADDPWIRRQLELLAELDMVVFFHSYAESAFESPTLLTRAFRGLDDLRIVVLDGMSSYVHTYQCIALAEQHPNIVFDTAMIWGPMALEQFLDTLGSQRLVFGSNLYSNAGAPGFCTPAALRAFPALDAEALQAVLHDNLARTLRLEDESA